MQTIVDGEVRQTFKHLRGADKQRAGVASCLLFMMAFVTPLAHAQPGDGERRDSEALDFLFEEPSDTTREEGGDADSDEASGTDARSASSASSETGQSGAEDGKGRTARERPGGIETIPVEPTTSANAAGSDDDDGREAPPIEEIVVTAQKREQSLSDVPISVQAFSADQLNAKGVLDIGDLPKLSPGVTVTTQVSYVSTYIRGVGSDAFLLADPSVAYYVDGIYYPFASGAVQDFGAVKRVEVLKGPQGTLFGRNAIGGAINVVTKSPDFETSGVSVQAITGRYDRPKARVYGNVPLSDTLALSGSVFRNSTINHIDGRDDLRPGNPEGDRLPRERQQGAQGKLRWSPMDAINLQFNAARIRGSGTGTQYAPNVEPSLLARLAGVEPQDATAGAVNEVVSYDRQNTTYSAEMTLDLGPLDTKVLASDQFIENFGNYDFDGSPEPLADFDVQPTFADVQTGEIQFLSNARSWGADWLDLIGGVYYFRSKQGFNPAFLTVLTTDLDAGTVFGIQLPGAVADLVRNAAAPSPLPSGRFQFVGVVETDSIAYFGQATADITSWFAMTLGARFQDEERILVESSSGLRNADGSTTQFQSFSGKDNPEFRDTTRSLDPKVSLDFRPPWSWLGQSPLLYLSWQTATKSSTFNAVNITDDPEFVRPEEIEAFELGIKTAFLGGRVRLNAAFFDYQITDLQVQFISLLEGGAVTFENAASAEIQGFDFDVVAKVAPRWIDGLSVTLGGAYLDAVYASYPDGSGFDPQTGLLTRNNDFSGNRVVRTPEFSGNAGLTKVFQTRSGQIELGVDYYYNSGFFYLAQNTPNVEEDAYGTLGATISYMNARSGLRLSLYGRNLLDESYNLSRFPTDFGVNDARAPGVVAGIRLNLQL